MKLKMIGEVYFDWHYVEPCHIGKLNFFRTMMAIEKGQKVRLTIEGEQAGHRGFIIMERFTGPLGVGEVSLPGTVHVGQYDVLKVLEAYKGEMVALTVEDAGAVELADYSTATTVSTGMDVSWTSSCPPAEVIYLSQQATGGDGDDA